MKALKELAEAREVYQKKIKEAGKSAVQEAAQAVFNAHPEINRIEWTQYTPYFNDGEPCTFSVHDVCFLGNEGNEEEVRWPEDREDVIKVTSGWGKDKKVLKAKAAEFAQLIADNEDLLETLGEGRVVISRKDGLSVEEIDHD